MDGINRSRLGRREKIGAATVERYFRHGLKRQFAEWHPPRCPAVLGIDEHFFTRRQGYAFPRLSLCCGRRVVADRFHVLRIVNHHFLACRREQDPVGSKNRGLLSLMRRRRHNLTPDQQARLATYLAQHPALELIYRFKQRLCYLLLKRHRTRKQCETLAPTFLRTTTNYARPTCRNWSSFGQTLAAWSVEIAAMWRFTRNNGITEGFQNKMELITR